MRRLFWDNKTGEEFYQLETGRIIKFVTRESVTNEEEFQAIYANDGFGKFNHIGNFTSEWSEELDRPVWTFRGCWPLHEVCLDDITFEELGLFFEEMDMR